MLRTGKTLKNGGFPPFFYLFPFYLINFSRKTTFREKNYQEFHSESPVLFCLYIRCTISANYIFSQTA
ncbi:MAG: hypothetical protein BHW56_00090 [Acetobacter sp. 46_36]|nr:MAG: hypothetical protein BHW56_00090 [Acetobacter sp. 46_36]